MPLQLLRERAFSKRHQIEGFTRLASLRMKGDRRALAAESWLPASRGCVDVLPLVRLFSIRPCSCVFYILAHRLLQFFFELRLRLLLLRLRASFFGLRLLPAPTRPPSMPHSDCPFLQRNQRPFVCAGPADGAGELASTSTATKLARSATKRLR